MLCATPIFHCWIWLIFTQPFLVDFHLTLKLSTPFLSDGAACNTIFSVYFHLSLFGSDFQSALKLSTVFFPYSAHPVLYRLYRADLEIGLIPLGVFSPALRLSCLPLACSNINISWTLQTSARFLGIGIENIQHNYLWNMVRKAKCRSWSYQEWFQKHC